MIKIDTKYRYKTASESFFGQICEIGEIGEFINGAVNEFKKGKMPVVSKLLIEVDEIFDGENEPYIMGYDVKVINVDLNGEFELKQR